jgi:hypothetical protein
MPSYNFHSLFKNLLYLKCSCSICLPNKCRRWLRGGHSRHSVTCYASGLLPLGAFCSRPNVCGWFARRMRKNAMPKYHHSVTFSDSHAATADQFVWGIPQFVLN